MPVPASRTSVISSSSITSTQDVLPPYFVVCGLGVGTEPRHPQIFRRSDTSGLATPEDDDDADELIGVCEQRKGTDLDLALDPVGTRDDVPEVCGTAFLERDPGR